MIQSQHHADALREGREPVVTTRRVLGRLAAVRKAQLEPDRGAAAAFLVIGVIAFGLGLLVGWMIWT